MKKKKITATVTDTISYAKNFMKPKQFYTRGSLKKIFEKLECDIKFPLEVISKALGRLKDQNFVTYSKSQKLWLLTPNAFDQHSSNCDCKTNTSQRPITDAESEIIKSLEKVTTTMAIKVLTEVAREIIPSILAENSNDLIITTTQTTVLEEIRTELKPSLHEYIDQKVKERIIADVEHTSNQIKNILNPFIERISTVEEEVERISKFFSELGAILP